MQEKSQQQTWDAIAPEWHELKKANDKIVLDFISSATGNFLDLGSGSGRYFTKNKAQNFALDFSKEMLNLAEEKVQKEKLGNEIKVNKTNNLKGGIANKKLGETNFNSINVKGGSSVGDGMLGGNPSRVKKNQPTKNYNFIQHDLTKKLPFQENFFDKAICIATLHCIETKKAREQILKEISRVLKPKGICLLKVWNRKNKRWKNKEERLIGWTDKGKRYYYFYTEEEILEELKKAKLKIISIESERNNLPSQEITIIVEK